MKQFLLLIIISAFLVTSIFARADVYANQRNRIFALERSEYLEDMYKYLFCVLTFGDNETRHAEELARRCKNPHLQNQILMDRNPTDQMFYSSIKGYEFDVQTLILCLAAGGARTNRSTTEMVVSYCDRVISPVN